MTRALRATAMATLSVGAAAYLIGFGIVGSGYSSMRYPFYYLFAVALLLGLVVSVLGLIASIQRRQFIWLAWLLDGAAVGIVGFVGDYLINRLVPVSVLGRMCLMYSLSSYPCPPSPNAAQVAQSIALVMILLTPGIVGLVGLLYSLRMGAAPQTLPTP